MLLLLVMDNTSPTAGLSLTSYENVKSAFTSKGALALINSGAMPKGGTKFSSTTINKIKGWIADNYTE